MLYLIIFIFGLIIGSFLNVIILRFDEIETIFYTRSRCPHCKEGLKWYDLIPLFSFLLLRGKCRYCKKPISFQYPLVELLTAIIFTLLFWRFGLTLAFGVHLVIVSLLIVVAVYDWLYFLISDALIYTAIIIWLIYIGINQLIQFDLGLLLNSLYGALGFGGFFALIVFASRERLMGKGDIALGFLIGLMTGWPLVMVSAFSTFMIGGVVASTLIFLRLKTRKDPIPFAPFLVLGLYIALLFFKDSFFVF